ncbi:helix-turn-helix transcriptional regulator [Microbacterium capsulatum]|uniref:helix-turn-helix domain-containing protein n=1 Tax=Microbacterium capsulatum TaxID=3041921 RepID=UPI002803AC8F|nr:helix-turn-helix transcriptional regulator [Microbacterium sp. ASV81]
MLYARELGLRVGKARAASGLTQERAAHAAGITTFTYRKLEKGESNPGTPANPRLSTLVALAEVFDVSVASLLPEEKPGIAVGR